MTERNKAMNIVVKLSASQGTGFGDAEYAAKDG